MVECARKGCDLTALWQVGVNLCFYGKLEPINTWTNICVCGIHKETTTEKDFGELETFLRSRIRPEFPNHLELVFYDISDGLWTNPAEPEKGRQPIPHEVPQ